jgi:hypothetical protein
VTTQVHELHAKDRLYRRSVMELAASKATIVSVDYQHQPTKMVWTHGNRAAKAILNIMDVETGEQGLCRGATRKPQPVSCMTAVHTLQAGRQFGCC